MASPQIISGRDSTRKPFIRPQGIDFLPHLHVNVFSEAITLSFETNEPHSHLNSRSSLSISSNATSRSALLVSLGRSWELVTVHPWWIPEQNNSLGLLPMRMWKRPSPNLQAHFSISHYEKGSGPFGLEPSAPSREEVRLLSRVWSMVIIPHRD
jgi:hypothetical protein